MEATGNCHLTVTRKRKPSRTTAIVAIQVFVIHVVALLSPAHSPLCQLQLLHFYPLHQNIKSSRFIFFGLSFTWGRMGKFLRPSSREEAQSSTPCASHMHPIPSAHSVQGCQGPAAGTSCIRDGAWSKCHLLFQGQLSELPPNSPGWLHVS